MTENKQLQSIILWSKKAPRRDINQAVARMVKTGLVDRVDLKLAAQGQRETTTQKKVIALTAYEIVDWVHDLEDEVASLESQL